MRKAILVTGGAGFIGSHFVSLLIERKLKVLVLDIMDYAASIYRLKKFLDHPFFELVEGDIADRGLLEALLPRVEAVVHFAAKTHVSRSLFSAESFFETQVMGTYALAMECIKRELPFFYISSSEVYGNLETESIDETHPLKPTNPYGGSKAAADRMIFSLAQSYDFPAVIIRPFNAYGEGQHLEKVIPRFCTASLLKEPIYIHGDGSQTRDWNYVGDIAEAIFALLQAENRLSKGEVFNIASGQEVSIRTIAQEIQKIANVDIQHMENRPGQIRRQKGNADKLKATVGWRPKVSFQEGLARTYAWYSQHRSFWEPQIKYRKVKIYLSPEKEVEY